MAKKEKIDYTKMSDAELTTSLKESNAALMTDKLNHTVTPLENPKVLMQQRKVIARLNTELRKRVLSKQA